MASEKIKVNLDKLGTIHKKDGKLYIELGADIEVFEGKKGNYIDVVRWENEPNQFGQTSSLVVSQPKGSTAEKRYIGNGEPLRKANNDAPASSVAPSGGSPFDSPF